MTVDQALRTLAAFTVLAITTSPLFGAADEGVLGTWREPGGSVIQVEPCGSAICARLVAISPSAPTQQDINNPDKALRQLPLCGLTIGKDFHLTSSTRAEGGTLYDPKSGRTYHGTMESKGRELSLRGYIGISLFGRTEQWTRITLAGSPCAHSSAKETSSGQSFARP